MEIGIHFGALAPQLKEQLDSQLEDTDYEINDDTLAHYQKDADAIIRLSVRRLIPDSVKSTAQKRLLKNITKSIKSK